MINLNFNCSEIQQVAESIKKGEPHQYISIQENSIKAVDNKKSASSMKEIAGFISRFNQETCKNPDSLATFEESFKTIKNSYQDKHSGLLARLVRLIFPSVSKEYKETEEMMQKAEQHLQSLCVQMQTNQNLAITTEKNLEAQHVKNQTDKNLTLDDLDKAVRQATREYSPQNSYKYNNEESIDMLYETSIWDLQEEEIRERFDRLFSEKWSNPKANQQFLVLKFDRWVSAQGGAMHGPSDIKLAMLRLELSKAGIDFGWYWYNDESGCLAIPLNDKNQQIEQLMKIASTSLITTLIQRIAIQKETVELKGWGLFYKEGKYPPQTIKANIKNEGLEIEVKNFSEDKFDTLEQAIQEQWPTAKIQKQFDEKSGSGTFLVEGIDLSKI